MASSRKASKQAPRLHLASNGTAQRARWAFVLLASRFHESMTRALVDGARQTLTRYGVARERIRTYWVPGAFELPIAAELIATALKPQAIIALGCVVKGETPQHAAIGQAVLQGLTQVSVSAKIPVTCGVIVADSLAQAKARAGLPAPRSSRRRGKARLPVAVRRRQTGQAGGAVGHRGREAAMAALAMVEFQQRLPQ